MGSLFAHLTSEDHRDHFSKSNFERVCNGLTGLRRGLLHQTQESAAIPLRNALRMFIRNRKEHLDTAIANQSDGTADASRLTPTLQIPIAAHWSAQIGAPRGFLPRGL